MPRDVNQHLTHYIGDVRVRRAAREAPAVDGAAAIG
jgi:hypothetical protein